MDQLDDWERAWVFFAHTQDQGAVMMRYVWRLHIPVTGGAYAGGGGYVYRVEKPE